jgi:hypothetical protein
MDTPPSIPPALPPQVLNADDQKLLKRARNAGRNLSILAILASIGSVLLVAGAFLIKEMPGVMILLAATISLVAAGYWVLAVAARRGNPNAVGVVLVVLIVQMCLGLITSGLAAAQTKSAYKLPIGGLVIPILILVGLASSRQVLLDLKQRNLWDRVFGSAKPSGHLCVVGGILVATGFIALNAGNYYLQGKAADAQDAEFRHANAFVELVQEEEKEFLTAMQNISGSQSGEEIDAALTKLKLLEENFAKLKSEAADVNRLVQILTTYGNALRQWRNGLTLLKEREPDAERAQKMFALGDQLREEAGDEFDRRYAEKRR